MRRSSRGKKFFREGRGARSSNVGAYALPSAARHLVPVVPPGAATVRRTVVLPQGFSTAGADESGGVFVVAEWRKQVGDVVQEGEPLVSVRPGLTPDAPSVLVPSPAFGVLARRVASVGEALEAGEPLAVLAGVPDAVTAALPSDLPTARPVYVPRGPEEAATLSAADRALAEHLALSARVSPHVFTVATADVSEPLRLIGRTTVSDAPPLTLLTFVVHATAAALRRFPALNAQFVSEGEVRRKGYVHVGVALRDGADRLAVPVLRDADRLGLPALARELAALTERARTRTLREADVRPGATFTLSEAPAGVLYQTPILHLPQAAFLSVGPVVRAPAVVTGADGAEALAVCPRATLCLAHDARLVDGVEAAAFLGAVIEGLSDAGYLFS